MKLTRKVGETLCIGDNIRVTVTERRGNWLVWEVQAPGDVLILREEVKDRKDD